MNSSDSGPGGGGRDTGWGEFSLRCPHCGNDLPDPLPEGHACLDHPLWRRPGRVLDLAREEHYWNHLPVEQMDALLESCGEHGWRQALDEHLAPKVDAYTLAYTTDDRRADWYPLCGVGESPRVIDVGAGWGAVTVALARQGARVLALDCTGATLDFLTMRAEQEGLGERVHGVRIDPLERAPLPVADGRADMIVMNGVLEWVGPAVDTPDPRTLQRRLLEDARRVLKPDGVLYLAIESRYSLAMWLGDRDHPDTRWTSVVPRPVASWLSRRQGKGAYRTWTHSYRALHRLLAEAGFSRRATWCPFPDYRFPRLIVPLDDGAAFRASIDRPGVSSRFAAFLRASSRVGLHRDLVPHYSVVARP